ncbi:MAG: PLP-dependent aminotransferase family protein [Clostridiales bacterium]|nr:PLP-dependent aminotransferase family protein [Clostridiales bacterium]
MRISIDRSCSIPVYVQIRERVREMILSGELDPGYRLPPERKLAEQLGVNRSTVLNAYDDLKADGLIGARVGQGTIVLAPSGELEGADPAKMVGQLPLRQLLSESASRIQQPLVNNILKNANRTDVISFAAGVSAYSFDPTEELVETQSRLLKNFGSTMLQYSATEGYLPFRESLSAFMSDRGIAAGTDEIAVLSGSQQGIDLAARIFLDPGDVVIVEEPSFFGAFQIFQGAGARLMGVPADDKGMRMDILESTLERVRPKFIYTVPTFSNPSGTVMELNRRKKLLELAYKYQVLIIEDDPYGELRYDGTHIPSLKALDRHGYVIYLSSFSKILFPGLRLGWVAADRNIIRQFVLAKQLADLHTNTLSQWIMDDFLRRGVLAGRLKTVIRENREAREIMTGALRAHAVKGFEWSVPEGGLYYWCKLPDGVDQNTLAIKAQERKVVVVPGNIFYPGYSAGNHIRLTFSSPPREKIGEGVRLLMLSVKDALQISGVPEEGAGEDIEIRPIL